MRVIHIVFSDVGGAFRAATRVNEALVGKGIESEVLVLESNNSNINTLFNKNQDIIMYKIKRKINDFIRKSIPISNNIYIAMHGVNLLNNSKVRNADIVHLHWIGYGTLSLKGIKKLTEKKNVVWTLHDMWAFTGGCYYTNECKNYKSFCYNCHFARGKISKKIIQREYLKKYDIFTQNIKSVIGCSQWITNEALEANINCRCIPNSISTEIFRPYDRESIRKKYEIEVGQKVVLFGAVSPSSDDRKGYNYLKEVLQLLNSKSVTVVVFGNYSEERDIIPNIKLRMLGTIDDDTKLAEIYSMADVFVAPSKQENLSNAVMESISCGTPVVAFNIGGMPDMIENGTNGFLIPPYNTKYMAKQIDNILKIPLDRIKIRETAVRKFNMKVIGDKHIKLYTEIMRGGDIHD